MSELNKIRLNKVIREFNISLERVVEFLSSNGYEIEAWIIDEFKKVGLDTAKSILEQDLEDLVKRTDLEEETIVDVRKILTEEFDESN